MLTVALLTSTLIVLAGARTYDRCELARDFQRLGVPREQVPTWVCIAFHESRLDTAAWNTYSGDHGLLQISELYWCGPGKACGLSCSSLRDDDISNDVQCALRIHREHSRLQGDGFMAWVVYSQYCRGNKDYIHNCDRHGKSYPENLYNLSQGLKEPDVFNFTVPQFANTGNVNRPLPSYLAVNSLIRQIDFEKFERDYYNSHKQKFDWKNFKIDNIDELKLPVGNRRGLIELELPKPPPATTYTTTTTARTKITLEPALIGIKPPSPRKIESNQFRGRKIKLEQQPYKTEKYSYVPTSTVTTSLFSSTSNTPINVKDSTLQTRSNYDLPLNKTSIFIPTTMKTTTTTTSTIIPQMTVKGISSHTLMDQYLPLTTTIKRTPGTTLRTSGEIYSENSYYKETQKSTTAKPATTRTAISRKINETVRSFKFDPTPLSRLEEYKNRDTEVTTKQPIPITYTISSSTYNRPSNRTTPSTINISENTKEYVPIENITLTSTTVSQTNAEQSFTTKPKPFSWGKSHYTQPTTQRPIFSSTSSRTAATQTNKLGSETSTATTTQSIFDLYLNPTRKPPLRPFSFAPFNKNPYKVRIFSGGTTISPLNERK